jgi:tight adherence protein B
MTYLVLVVLFVAVCILAYEYHQHLKHSRLINNYLGVHVDEVIQEKRAFDIGTSNNYRFFNNLRDSFNAVLRDIGDNKLFKITLFYTMLTITLFYVNNIVLKIDFLLVISPGVLVASYLCVLFLKIKRKKLFEIEFPNILNMIVSVVTSGESLMNAIVLVGETFDSDVGMSFYTMGERMKMGENPSDVLAKSCHQYPYPSYYFFVITLKANISRGGQLKEIMGRLCRVLFNAKIIEKKKMSMTSEARSSAKIVCSIPFIFLFGIMQFLTPENFDFVMNDPTGRLILYYMLGSEAIGMMIIYSLLMKVK